MTVIGQVGVNGGQVHLFPEVIERDIGWTLAGMDLETFLRCAQIEALGLKVPEIDAQIQCSNFSVQADYRIRCGLECDLILDTQHCFKSKVPEIDVKIQCLKSWKIDVKTQYNKRRLNNNV